MQLAVREVCREVGGDGAAHLVTRETGGEVRGAIARRLEVMPGGEVMTLDFSGIGIVDFSCADECLAKLLTRLVAGEYGEKYVRLAGLGASPRENVQVALERKRLSVLLVESDGSWVCLGALTPHLRETLRLVMASPGLSARDLAGQLGLELTTASTRLGSLHRQRLVRRRERVMGEGGREYVYESLASRGRAGAGASRGG